MIPSGANYGALPRRVLLGLGGVHLPPLTFPKK
nr:MAG TPA: Ras-related protein Rab-9A, Small G domain, Rab9A, RUTBC2, Rab [Caudoviricetes sp.]